MTVLNFEQISVNISKTVQDRDIFFNGRLIGSHNYAAHRMASVSVTLNGLEDRFRLHAFSSAFVQHFTRFQLKVCSRGPSATAGLLVMIIVTRLN